MASSEDFDLASQQLFEEISASAKKKPSQAGGPPSSAAIQSASLLNAARIDRRHPVAAPARAGKLKPVGLLTSDVVKETRREPARRGDVFDIGQPSPKKKTSVPAAKSRQKLPKLLRKVPQREAPPNTENLTSHDVAEPEGEIVESLPAASPEPTTQQYNLPEVRDTHPRGSSSARKSKGAHPKVIIPGKESPREIIRVARGKSSVPTDLMVQPNDPPQSAQRFPEPDLEPRNSRDVKRRKVKKIRPVHTTAGLEIESDNDPSPEKRLRPSRQVRGQHPPAETERHQRREGRKPTPAHSVTGADAPASRTRATRSKSKAKRTDAAHTADLHDKSPQDDTSQVQALLDRRHVAAQTAKELEDDHTEPSNQAATHVVHWLSSDEGIDEEFQAWRSSDEEDQLNDEDSYQDRIGPISEIEQVFEFLKSDEFSGECRTEEGAVVQNSCVNFLEILADDETTLDEVSTTIEYTQNMIAAFGAESDDKTRGPLKIDAYAYLFRHLVRLLQALHEWLSQTFEEYESNLAAMSVIAPLVSAIVSTRDRIADWKVRIPSRYKGASLVKDVDNNVIAPLRRVDYSYLATLRDLQKEDQKMRADEELARERRERQQQLLDNQAIQKLKHRKLSDWQDLHVCRLQLEPDPFRRTALRMNQEYFDKQMAMWTQRSRTAGREERDANGVPFSRVDLFKKRVMPPASPYSIKPEQKEWRDEQLEALVEGLQRFAGPRVFPKIFEYYCGIGQPLRRFGVPEITDKALEVKVRLEKTYAEQDWDEVPKWIAEIPELP